VLDRPSELHFVASAAKKYASVRAGARANRGLRLPFEICGLMLIAQSAFAQFNPGPNPITGTVTTKQTISSGTGTVNGTLSVTGNNVAITVTGSSSIVNNGTIQQTTVNTGSNAGNGRAIRDNTGNLTLTVTNAAGALIQTADADDFQMNKAGSTVTLNNFGTINSLNASAGGNQAIDWNALNTTIGANTLNNFSTGVISASEADAVRPGVNGIVNNDGLIKSNTNTGSSSDGIDAQTNSGISIFNAASAGTGAGTGTIEGARHGITGGDTTGGVFRMSVTNNLGGTIQGDNGSGINIDGINANELVTIANRGTITGNGHDIGDGKGHDGDGIDVDGLVNVTNSGTIRSINAFGVGGIEFSEGITAGGGTIVNSGTIEGSVASGNTTAVGRGITIAGVDKDPNDNPIPIQAPYGAATITNSGLIKGDSDSAIIFSSALASGFSHTITNQAGGMIQTGSTTAPAILTAADNVTINNAGTIDGSSSGKAISGGSGSLAINILGGQATILGDVAGGPGTNTATINPGAGNSFGYAGSISNFSAVEVQSGQVTFSGANTYIGTTHVTGGTLRLEGANRLAAGSALELGGGTLEVAGAGGANGQTFASLILSGNSILDLDSSSVTFQGLGSVSAGKTLTVLDWSAASSPDYAFRFAGDDSTNLAFLALINGTTIDGASATFRFDGTYTDVSAVPLPGTLLLLLSGMCLVGVLGARSRSRGPLGIDAGNSWAVVSAL
jgi:autotransporter-associated beta strand protein